MKARRPWLVVPLLLVVLLRPGAPTLVEAADPMFGNGADGAITFSSNTQLDPPLDAAVVSGSMGGSTLMASGAFVTGQRIIIHQTRGSGAGMWELNSVQSYALGNITTSAPLAHTYASSGADRAQVLVVPQYSNVTVNAGVTVTAKPWNGATGGILAFLANGTVTLAGTITATGTGYLGGAGATGVNSQNGFQGEGTAGAGGNSSSANGNGGGAGLFTAVADGGGGGGNGTAGGQGSNVGTAGGVTAGTATLSTMVFGGGGGGNATGNSPSSRAGGRGAGAVVIIGSAITSSGAIRSDGGAGGDTADSGGSGGGAGGSILMRGQTITLGTSPVTAAGGVGGLGISGTHNGGAGGGGRIRAEYCQTISGGIADPPASVAQISCASTPSVGGIAEQPDESELKVLAAPTSGDDRMAYSLGGASGFVALVAAAAWVVRRRRKVNASVGWTASR